MKINDVMINGRIFKKSSYSTVLPSTKCVGVSMSNEDVLVTNISQQGKQMLRFTREEWEAFIKGVKNREFDLTANKEFTK